MPFFWYVSLSSENWDQAPQSGKKVKKKGSNSKQEKYRRESIFPQSLAWSKANCVRFQLLLKCRKLSYKDFNFGWTILDSSQEAYTFPSRSFFDGQNKPRNVFGWGKGQTHPLGLYSSWGKWLTFSF